ncbi:MAG: alpha/beta hydrolase [Clostridia bacterium]|nr:alpha/beta hydrolase [Clostridia bacterium]
MKFLGNICYAKRKSEDLLLDIYLPEASEFSVFVFFHGGGFTKGSKSRAEKFAGYLTGKGIAVVSADYRMYPNAKYPDFIEDAAEAVYWVSENINNYGKCEKMFVGGSSAGAYLSMMLCFDARWLSKYGELKVPVTGYFHNAGQPTCHFNVLQTERGVSKKRVIVDDSAPIYHVGTAEEYPPMHFVVSDNDMECRYEQTMLMLATFKHFGYDSNKIGFTLVHGKHCEHDKTTDENGDNILGKMVFEFIRKW